MFRWNFSSRARSLSGGDAIVVSIPKSGRTWVRTFLCAYFCKRFGYEFTLEPEKYGARGIPRVIYTHDRFEQRTKADRWDRVRGKYLIPRRQLQRAAIILLARDPRDAFVSLHVQLTRRVRESPDELKQKSAAVLLRDEQFGIGSMIDTMNGWLREWSGLPRFHLVSYEMLRAAPAERFRELLNMLGEKTPDESALESAVEFADFGNMRKLEAAGAFESKILRAGDVADPESFKVRRGKIGGYADYLSKDDIAYANAAMARLDRRFGYEQ